MTAGAAAAAAAAAPASEAPPSPMTAELGAPPQSAQQRMLPGKRPRKQRRQHQLQTLQDERGQRQQQRRQQRPANEHRGDPEHMPLMSARMHQRMDVSLRILSGTTFREPGGYAGGGGSPVRSGYEAISMGGAKRVFPSLL